jgi:hypothetical protein
LMHDFTYDTWSTPPVECSQPGGVDQVSSRAETYARVDG